MTKRARIFNIFLLLISCIHYSTIQAQDEISTTAEAQSDDNVTLAEYLNSLRRARSGLIAAAEFESALNPAELIVEELPQTDPAYVSDQIMRAYILTELDRFDEAELIFLEAIELQRAAEGLYSAEMVAPLQILGRSYVKARQFPQAITVFEEARTASQRSEGLFNENQTILLDDLTTAYLGAGDTVAAEELQLERLRVAQRQFGPDDERVIPYYYHLADYYERSRLAGSARRQFEEALAISAAKYGEDSVQNLKPLLGIARLDLQLNRDEAALERITELLATPQDAELSVLAEAHAVLGDWAITEEALEESEKRYAQAYAILSADEQIDADAYFADPAVIRFIPPLTNVDRNSDKEPYGWGTIALEFDLDPNGRVAKITGIGATPTDQLNNAYVERLMAAYLRPALVDGIPVAAEGIMFTHYFRYFVEEEETDD